MTNIRATAEDLRAAAPAPSPAAAKYLDDLDMVARMRAAEGYVAASMPHARWKELSGTDRAAVTLDLNERGFCLVGDPHITAISWSKS